MVADSVVDLNGVGLSYTKRQAFFRNTKFSALKNISFSIKRGETLGIIGANGSGKSTLLRVIAGIYRADEGKIVRQCSRISLLSLALGFDPQLTGRDNIILSGMLLGARKHEVSAKTDRIIAFSELRGKIEEPLKTYSSGMRARLGFSIAIEMNVELLLIDEILGVGDTGFRKKAEAALINKINSDQTVVFVSHSLDEVNRLCDRVVWLHNGHVKQIGSAADTIGRYKSFISNH